MAPRRFSQRGRFDLSGLALALALPFSFVGCADDQNDDGSSTGGGTATGGSSGAGGNTTGGQPSTGGQSATGGQAATAGQSTGGMAGSQATGGSGGTMGQTGGTSSGGAGAAGSPSGGAQNGGGGGAGASTGGAAGAPTGGASGSGGGPSGACTRELLDGLLTAYFTALSAGDPSSLPLAANVKFTENAMVAQLGMTPFWMNAGDVKHSQRALDTTTCSAAAQAVVPENATDLPIALRIKVDGGELTEIETIVVRQGDYTASFAVDSNPAAIISIADDIGWHDEVPQAQRPTRQELTAWVDKYFRAFPSGVCNVTSACRRLENGGGNFSCGSGATCSNSTPTTGGTFEPRVIVVDEVRGIAAGLTIFDFMTDGHLDMHMIKMSGGQVHAVHAILRDTNGQSGWD